MDSAIRVENLAKKYYIGALQARYGTLRDTIASTVSSPFRKARRILKGEAHGAAQLTEAIWALKDINFQVSRGEVLGVIGQNGAGKSTLLKVLSRITEPTEGLAEIRGRVGSLLEVGTGFHPELTGRENIFLNGAILGMRRSEIRRKMEAIIDFAEIEKFIDTPVKYYSSGMYVRLAFSVAAHLEPEILLVDEVLAVGDISFQRKCMGKMGDVAGQGRTILFVSHSMRAITSLCQSAIRLSAGQIVDRGPASEVVRNYVALSRSMASRNLKERTDRRGNGEVRFTRVRFFLGGTTETDSLLCGQDCSIELDYEAEGRKGPLAQVSVSITLTTNDGVNLSCLWDKLSGEGLQGLPPSGTLRCRIPKLPLMPGRYGLMLVMTHNGQLSDKVVDAAELIVVEGDYYGTGKLPPAGQAAVVMAHSWEVGP